MALHVTAARIILGACGCFGTLIKVPLTKSHLVEDLVTLALAIIVFLGTIRAL